MTIRLQEVVRSEVEGGLSGPARPLPDQSIDCGCMQLPCPGLARFATRRLYVGLICWVGLMQAASLAYFYIVGPTIARRFDFDPYLMDWILVLSELTPFLFGLLVAYWGDRIHRASWTGALVLLQSACYFMLIIPHLTHHTRVIEETVNVTHMSLYADDSPELCSAGSSRIVIEEDEPCYFTLALLIVAQIIAGAANIAYYSLGISYLDDNTKKKHIAALIGVILAVKIIGVLLGYILAWGCLKIDAEELTIVESYREQIGAWWLGFPILSLLLIVPGLLLSWFPRRLPSEVVKQAAATLLGRGSRYNRGPHRTVSQNVGSANFWPSFIRLITNLTLLCNIMAFVFCITAIINFVMYENIILEARFYVPRPTGMLLGFGDPLPSRLTSSMLRPILIGLVIIISGLVISRAKPRAKFIAGYSFVMIILAAIIFFTLIFLSCDKPPIVGMGKKSINLLRYCNKDCRCSKDADFRPICNSQGNFTFYSPCHAGCTTTEYVDNVRMYSGCSCVEEMTGQGNHKAIEGPCGSANCQVGWLFFEFGTMTAYALISSTFVGDLLIGLRSVYKQDKAIAMGFWMTWVAIIVNVPGKILYETVANLTCRHWGFENSICHLHDSNELGDYLCYLTILLLIVSSIFKVLVWIFTGNLHIYNQPEETLESGTEMRELMKPPEPETREEPTTTNNEHTSIPVETPVTPEPEIITTIAELNTDVQRQEEVLTKEPPLKYGPLGPGDRRTSKDSVSNQKIRNRRSGIRNLDSEDELNSSSDESKRESNPKVAYRPLDIDSDVESDLSSTGPRSRKRIVSKDYDQSSLDRFDTSLKTSGLKKEFPNPEHYENLTDKYENVKDRNGRLDGSSKTNSFEFSKTRQGRDKEGDFNEVGIPIVDPSDDGTGASGGATDSNFLKGVKSLIESYEHHMSQETLDDQSSVKSNDSAKNRLKNKIISGVPLVAMASGRPSSRARSSSGFDSLPDNHDKAPETFFDARETPSPKNSKKDSKGAIITNL